MGTLFQDLASQFHQSFIEADRWKRYLDGIGISFTVTLGALLIGIVLGILVAIVRTLHDKVRTAISFWVSSTSSARSIRP